MARREWTLLVISDDETCVRQIRVSREVVRVGIAAALLVLSVLSSLAAGYVFAEREESHARELEAKNELLAAELDRIRQQVSAFEASVAELSQRDTKYRLLAGLEPLPEEVRRAGIGGPGGRSVESDPLWRLDAEAGESAFAVSTDLSTLIRRARVLSTSWDEATATLRSTHERLEATPSISPTAGIVSSAFSRRRWHPILHRPRPHEGVDIAATRGTPIYAAAKGRVTFSGRQGDYGLMVEIDHGFGYVTRYAHASRLHVRVGQTVQRGDRIADVGDTGLAVAPHVHYEVLVDGRPMNPRNFILGGEALPE